MCGGDAPAAAAEQLPREVLERLLLGIAQLLARRRVEAAAAALGAENAGRARRRPAAR